MYVLFACGGTAGHIYPALSMARLLREFDKNTRIEFVGTPGGMENRLVPQEGYPIYPLHVSGIARKLSFSNLKAVWQSVVAYMKCRNRMKADRPDLVIGTGGYVCFPVLRAAASLGIPNAVHESNAIPGLAVKAVASKTDRIWLGQKEAVSCFTCKDKCLYTGTPLRNGFLLENKYDIRRKMGLPHNAFFVLSFGGSLGAEKLTEAVYDLWKETSDPRLHFLHIRGRSPQNLPAEDERHRTLAYADQMPSLMQAADLVICRAGAMTLTELAACGKASILIPSPNVTDNHQYRNARALSDCGAAAMICEDELSGKRLAEYVSGFLASPDRRRRMEEISRSRCKKDTDALLLREMLRLSGVRQPPADMNTALK